MQHIGKSEVLIECMGVSHSFPPFLYFVIIHTCTSCVPLILMDCSVAKLENSPCSLNVRQDFDPESADTSIQVWY